MIRRFTWPIGAAAPAGRGDQWPGAVDRGWAAARRRAWRGRWPSHRQDLGRSGAVVPHRERPGRGEPGRPCGYLFRRASRSPLLAGSQSTASLRRRVQDRNYALSSSSSSACQRACASWRPRQPAWLCQLPRPPVAPPPHPHPHPHAHPLPPPRSPVRAPPATDASMAPGSSRLGSTARRLSNSGRRDENRPADSRWRDQRRGVDCGDRFPQFI